MAKRLVRHPMVQNALALYGVQFADYLLPLLTVPYLARVLRPTGWGLVIFAQAAATWLALVLEYGFTLSGTRELARHKNDRAKAAEIVANIMGASGLLAFACLAATFVLGFCVPTFRKEPILIWLAFGVALTQGLRPIWYFQGMERLTIPAGLNVLARLLATAGIFLWVRKPGDTAVVLGLQAGCGGLSLVIAFVWMYREIAFLRPRFREAVAGLRLGWSMFLFRGSASLYTTANSFVLGLFVAPAVVAFYGGAERISRLALGLLGPVSQVLYPHMAHVTNRSREEAARLARTTLFLMGGCSICGAALLAALAPLGIRLLLGPQYHDAVPVLRVLVLLIPAIALSNVFGIQWMLPLGMDATFNKIIVAAGFLNITMAVLLAPRFGAIGMAWAVVTAESFVTIAMWYAIRRSGNSFWKVRGK